MESTGDSNSVPAFQLQNKCLSDRCRDVFGSLDALEQKHQAFEKSRARDDADADKRLIHQGPSDEETETVRPSFKRPTFTGRDYHESRKGGRHGHERAEQQQFRKPMPPQTQYRGRNSSRGRYGRSRAEPDHKLHPERWTEYSLEDVDTSDTANKRAALDFLHERRKMREDELKEEVMDLETTACSKGLFTFKRPTKQTSDTASCSDTEKQKPTSNFEKMEDDNNDFADVAELEEDLDRQKDFKSPSSFKRKLENKDLLDESEDSNVEEKSTGFKSRKKIKRNFRAQRDNDADDITE
ncbi:protein TSSC4-like isoform X2 [Mercenaria mercenaria]|nr:protein TSSC4-like isoform X2 [Mercenaria mercenaria]